jgi:exopolysaccharide biosynthesis polyprenyl glycosylphosphotransferase
MNGRLSCLVRCAVLDVAALTGAYFVALVIRDGTTFGHLLSRGTCVTDWSLAVMLVATLLAFAAFGLYTREAHVSRPLLLRTLVKGAATALIVSAVTVYFVKSPFVNQSRFLLLSTFALFVPLCALLRLSVPARLYRRRVAEEKPLAFVVGRSARSDVLKSRLSDLSGFSRWKAITCDGDVRDYRLLVAAALDQAAAAGRAVQAVIIDAGGLPLQGVLPLVQQVRARGGCDVYVLSDLAWPLRPTSLLGDLFEAPVLRVRRRLPNGAERRAKRLLDVALSAVALAVLALPMAAIALLVKLTSPGPLLHRDERVGLRGHGFCLYKFRTMVVGDDQGHHREYVRALIAGQSDACNQGDPEEHVKVLKINDDDRITRFGRLLRRYSLDELPQLWNVLRGDMSLVGPRPPLPYEVEAYTDWHRQRLQALPGISGLWQIGGRSRVTFDEMVFQDLFYATNQSPLLDLAICLRTVPAVINGRGAV